MCSVRRTSSSSTLPGRACVLALSISRTDVRQWPQASTDRTWAMRCSALAISVAGLRGALETSVQLREDPNANAMGTLIDENAQTVSQRRQDVRAATDALAVATN